MPAWHVSNATGCFGGGTALPSERLDAVLPCPSVQASAVAALLDEREGFLVRSLDPSAA